MGVDLQRAIVATITNAIEAQFPKSKLRDAAFAMGKELVRIHQDRTMEGYGADGKRLKPLAKSTLRRKTRLLLRGKVGRRRFRATTPQDVARLTGQTLGDMQVKRGDCAGSMDGKKITLKAAISFATGRSEDVAGYLEEGGRRIVGLCPPGTQRGKAERQRLQVVALSVLRMTGEKFKV